MTCVVALIENGVCYMGADSCYSNYLMKSSPIYPPKITKFDNLILGYAGRPSIMTDYLLKNTINDIIEAGLYYREILKQDIYNGTCILIGSNNIIFHINNYVGITAHANYYAIGDGSPFAIGSIYTSLKNPQIVNTKNKITYALEAANMHGRGVDDKFIYLNT